VFCPPLRTREAVPRETPARSATSLIVGMRHLSLETFHQFPVPALATQILTGFAGARDQEVQLR
jgi:hypothetical protein